MAFYSYVNEALSCDVILTVESLHACKAVLLAIIACVCSLKKKGEKKKQDWGTYFSCLPLSPSDPFRKHAYGQLVIS